MSRDPAATRRPSITPCSPEPMDSRTCSGTLRPSPRSIPAWTMAAARTWCDACSSEAPSINTSSADFSRRHFDRKQPRAADRQRSGLVEQHGMGARQRFQRAAALDQDAAPGRLRDAGDEGDGRGQDQGARRRRDQHREAADQIARDQPGDEGKHERHRQEDQRVAIGQPHERRFGGLRRGHHPHDAGIGAFAGRRGHRQFEGLADIQRTGEDGARRAP